MKILMLKEWQNYSETYTAENPRIVNDEFKKENLFNGSHCSKIAGLLLIGRAFGLFETCKDLT